MKEISNLQCDEKDYVTACFPMINLYYRKLATITRLRELMETELKGTNLTELGGNSDKSSFVSNPDRAKNICFLSYVKAFLII